MKITAYAIKNKGGKAQPLSYERRVGKNEVLVRITHCGMAKGDVQGIEDEWGDTKFPLVPGHEMVGFIEETGRQVTGLEKGDRVMIVCPEPPVSVTKSLVSSTGNKPDHLGFFSSIDVNFCIIFLCLNDGAKLFCPKGVMQIYSATCSCNIATFSCFFTTFGCLGVVCHFCWVLS